MHMNNRTLLHMTTEMRNPHTMDLDIMSPLEIITTMNQEDETIPSAIKKHLEKIAKVAEWGIESLQNNGRIFYIGAGTSGRLGVLDAAECPSTFGVSPDTVIGLIAGGDSALTQVVWGAEDNRELGKKDLEEHELNNTDLVIGLSASGRTPYVLGGLEYAGSIGCHTAAISCNEDTELGRTAELGIDIIVGPEILTGSTRLKAGTVQKMVLNMISTAVMAGIGKVYGNLMVDVVQTNAKLRTRALQIVIEATGAKEEICRSALMQAGGKCKTAITMILANCDPDEAERRLATSQGRVREAIIGRKPD